MMPDLNGFQVLQRSYISSLMEVPYISGQTLPAYRIIELMAAAQLLIRFQVSYRDSVKKLLFNLHKQIGSQPPALSLA